MMRWPLKLSLQAIDIGPTDMRRIAFVLFIFFVAALGLLTALVFEKQQVGPQGEKGERGEPGPAGAVGPRGLTGVAGQSATTRFIDGECRQSCNVACEANERIISTFAIYPGGTFVFVDESRATFQPPRGQAVKVVVACAPK